jgi:cob(I)alamin adenosyltransferase
LFDLGADLCAPQEAATTPQRQRLRVSEVQVRRLEEEIDRMNARLAPLRSFVLPGGSPAAAALHVARTVCRRAEREIVALADQPGEHVSPQVLKYINRLSDLLFVASRAVNDLGAGDVLWVPGGNR